MFSGSLDQHCFHNNCEALFDFLLSFANKCMVTFSRGYVTWEATVTALTVNEICADVFLF